METAWEDEEEEKPARRRYLWKTIWQAVFWIYVVSWIPMLWWSEPIYREWWHGLFQIALCGVWIGPGYWLYPRAFPTSEARDRLGSRGQQASLQLHPLRGRTRTTSSERMTSQDRPEFLYRYRSNFDFAQSEILERRVFAAPRESLNDHTEAGRTYTRDDDFGGT